MPVELTIRPQAGKQQLARLKQFAEEFDATLEKRQIPTEKQWLALGTNLWAALTAEHDDGLQTLLDAREQAVAQQTFVQLNLLTPDKALQNLPWEMVFHGDERLGFLARNPYFSLLRRLAEPDRAPLDLPAGPLRILLFIASPEDLDPEKARLDFENEENHLFEQLDEAISRGEAVVEVAEDGTPPTLKSWLQRHSYHVVHFSMHGKLEEHGPVLSFEHESTGLHHAVNRAELQEALRVAVQPPPCIVLSACQTALTDTRAAIPSFAQPCSRGISSRVLGPPGNPSRNE